MWEFESSFSRNLANRWRISNVPTGLIFYIGPYGVHIDQYIGPFIPKRIFWAVALLGVAQPPLIMLTLGAYWKSPDSEEKSATSGGTCTGEASGCGRDTWQTWATPWNTREVTINIWRPIPTSKSQRSPTLICQGFLFVLRMVIWYMWPTTWIFSGGLKGWNFTAFKRLAAFVISC